ncbi:MAG: recombination protein RecR [Candidatus Yanofskybacteria bacterium RIFCSPHIGHO2_02_FULL_50_12]|uniref:Recombination protein RecR n=1 Tax=Candidatus Yanofskybacteria bacterium RIFCSPHIGHO2_02_FULL_50_12 TaxID=1802685 RepID=A0A1F8FUS7_9BACT|nr:MAG: recombination protein RecR [Candidatus Yanofskybacteria bacterium RIFCSPHIGHO2_02_FULL_50_12]
MDRKFKQIAKLFQKLPGVGPRQAARFVLALLEKPEAELQELGFAVANLKKEISLCGECFNLSDNGLCGVCSNPGRDRTKLLVVEKVTDLDSVEKTGLYKGLYHVLGGSINPLDGVLPQNLRIKELEQRVATLIANSPVELILATNPSTTGETTALYLRDYFTSRDSITITRLGRGLASGSNLEYADEITLRNALESRR